MIVDIVVSRAGYGCWSHPGAPFDRIFGRSEMKDGGRLEVRLNRRNPANQLRER